ncbi:DinB family protein [Paenibacillus sacheonensis]|uniref:DUF1572 domain-containing protein n=1 Tax=Paenibacillus sacheonensis TaxID=742054 RepID=A0A7X4YPR5_9BACL|nr:DinB family protein [Paenibacillus sacheonensis]MBM7564913.1 putative damage-inducible protein DinB [Paenibacillus sacheonensis]NBC70297.1 DUF1572 domain-containing protein [Paenibacillus sacheonensis]
MDEDFNRQWLLRKFEEIRRRMLLAIDQLDDDQLNWRPDPTSHSIAALIKHIEGNVRERIVKGMLRQDVQRNREAEFNPAPMAKSELQAIVRTELQLIIDMLASASNAKLAETQLVRGRERTHWDMLHQCAAHYSEHMGQIFYMAKLCLKDAYTSTSI